MGRNVSCTSLNEVFGTIVRWICLPIRKIMKARALDPAKFKGGLFFGGGMDQLIAQLTGIVATAVYVMIASAICWMIIKASMGMRVSKGRGD